MAGNGVDTADTIIDATMALVAERPFADVTVVDIARAAGVSLAELNAHFSTRHAILAAFSRRIDGIVLAADMSDMADESPRDRLFDVLMTRLDALRPYRAALQSLLRSARRDPELALSLNAAALRSQAWMLAAAGVTPKGWRGRLAVQSLVAAFAKVLRTFLAEDDVGLPRTMASLDQELKTLEARHDRLARFFGGALRTERQAEEAATPFASAAAPAPPEPEPAPPEPEPAPPEPAPAKPKPHAARKTATGGARKTAGSGRKTVPKRPPFKKDEPD